MIRQKAMCFKIDLELLERLEKLNTWNWNKNRCLNNLIKRALPEAEWEQKKQMGIIFESNDPLNIYNYIKKEEG